MFIRKIFGTLLLLAVLAVSTSVSAEKTDWYDRSYNFRNIRTVIVLDPTFMPGVYYDTVELRNMQDKFLSDSRKLRCNVITEAQARQMLSYQLGMNLNGIPFEQARHVVIDNAYRIADAWVLCQIDNMANNSYVEPARTVWEQKEERRTYYDAWGNRREEKYYVQVPVTYPPRRVDVTSIQVTMTLSESRGGAAVFTRRDVRDREDYQAQGGMFGRISNSFFEDVGKRMR